MIGPYRPGYNGEPDCGIYCGDGLVLAKAIPDGSVDIVFTSPPYNVGIAYEASNDNLPDHEFWQFQEDWLREAHRVTQEYGRLYVTVSDKMLWQMQTVGERVGWRFHQLLVWCKTNISGGRTRVSCDWNLTAEWCLLFHRSRRTPMLNDVGGVNTFNWIAAATTQSNFNGHRRKVHPAQMSLSVAYAWLARTPGEIVLDPFVGSGTTAMAAKMLDKQYLGFDNGPDTCTLARERIRNTQPPLIVPGIEQLALPGLAREVGA
jgi:site-specific DNA-methyltransferase (adenine-specific)